MKLRAYLDSFKPAKKPVEFAVEAGISQGTVYKWLEGNRKPWPIMRKHIEQVTKGKVTINDW